MTKIQFLLQPDEDGWPPFAGETLWAVQVDAYRYRLDNIPWYARDVACYDVVEAVAFEPDDMPVFTRVLERSGHLTIRLIPAGAPSIEDFEAVMAEFIALGASGEGYHQEGIMALDIPPEAALEPVKDLLVLGEVQGRWGFEEGSVTDAWRAL